MTYYFVNLTIKSDQNENVKYLKVIIFFLLCQYFAGLMGRFLKENPLREATSTLKLLHVAFQDSSLHKEASKIDIGFAAETTLNQLKSSKKISERQVLEIKMECKKLLITLTEKLLKKGPVHHQLVRSMQCLDPRRMAVSKELCVPQMRRMLHTLVEAKHVDESVCDDILREFSEFCDSAALQANFLEFDPKTDRVDTLLYETMGSKPSFSRVWDVVKVLLVLSHGQASVERGFSINKEMIVENQKEMSLVAQRLIPVSCVLNGVCVFIYVCVCVYACDPPYL